MRVFQYCALGLALVLAACQEPTAPAGGETASPRAAQIDYAAALAIEMNYITQCSWTVANPKNSVIPATDRPGFGAINDWRIGNSQADNVEPGAATMGIVGLMVGYNRLVTLGRSNPTLDFRVKTALSGFFWSWVRNQGNQVDVGNVAFPKRLVYDAQGNVVGKGDINGAVTAQVLIAMRQYCRLSPNGDRTTYQNEVYPLAKKMAQYIDHGLSGWTLDKSYGVAAFRGFANWARSQNDLGTADYYDRRAQDFQSELLLAQDRGDWRNYYSYLDGNNNGVYFSNNAGVQQIDQTGFAPYEFNARPAGEDYAKDTAWWWDHGKAFLDITPTVQSGPYAGGVHQQIPDLANKAYPGSCFQLADAEWKIARANGNQNDGYGQAWKHYLFGLSPVGSTTGSGCWNNSTWYDRDFQGGFIDWVDDGGRRPPNAWERFVDTSAYMAVATEELVYSTEFDWGS